MDETQKAIRKAARKRALLVPGTGFALLGYSGLAALDLAYSAIALAVIALVCYYPASLLLWLAVASVLGAILLMAIEYLAEGWIAIHPSGESSPISRHFKLVCALAYAIATFVTIYILLSFGSFVFRGDGMSPVFLPGELILYHKKVMATDLRPGQLIAFKIAATSSWGSPGDHVIGRILAVPGDAMSIRGTHYQVNAKESVEISGVGRFRVVLDIPDAPAQTSVPTDCFFIVQEQPSDSLDSRTLSWARREDIVATRLWLLSRRGFGQEIR